MKLLIMFTVNSKCLLEKMKIKFLLMRMNIFRIVVKGKRYERRSSWPIGVTSKNSEGGALQ
jgi:hypothetical protein